jgi:hypothetical protein
MIIARYNLPTTHGPAAIDVPYGSRLLSAGIPFDRLVGYFATPAGPYAAETRPYQLYIATDRGSEIATPFRFICTVHTPGYVWHVFDLDQIS